MKRQDKQPRIIPKSPELLELEAGRASLGPGYPALEKLYELVIEGRIAVDTAAIERAEYNAKQSRKFLGLF